MALVAPTLAAAGPVIPNYSAHSSRCVVENHFFCGDWVTHNWGSVLWPALQPAHHPDARSPSRSAS